VFFAGWGWAGSCAPYRDFAESAGRQRLTQR
jgi:hypothetical protein